MLAALVLAASCDGSLTSDGSGVERIEVTPSSLSLLAGETRGLSARVVDAAGAPVADRRVFWSVRHPQIATVSSSGIVTALAPGSTEVAASSGGRSGIVPVTVSDQPVTLVRVSPTIASVQVGRTILLSAEGVKSGGGVLAGRPVVWTSGAPTIATVSDSGMVTGIAAGEATITATIDGVSGTATVRVQDAPVASVSVSPAATAMFVGQSLQLTATTRDADGTPLPGRTMTWVSSASTIASVSSTGMVTALAAGTATVTASSEGRTGTASVTVSPTPVHSVTVVPGTATLSPGATAQLLAQVMDSAGHVLNGRSVSWSSDQAAVASVSAAGLVSAVAPGQARITATVEGKSGSAAISVTPTPVASLALSPASLSLQVGANQRLTATARDAQGNVLSGRVVTWLSGGPTVATVDPSGLVTAIGLGTALIIATCEGRQASASVSVTPVTVSSIIVVPNTVTVTAGATVQLNVTALDGSGVAISSATVGFSSADPAIASVSSTGLVSGVAAGATSLTVTAAAPGQPAPTSATVGVTVTPPAPARLDLAPLSGTIHIGDLYARSVTAQAYDASGAPIPAQLGWSTSDAARLAVSPTLSGATIVASGTPAAGLLVIATTVSQPAVADTLVIDSDLVPIARVTVTPASATLTPPQTQVLTATAADSAGNAIGTSAGDPLGGRVASWSLNNTMAQLSPASGMTTTLTAVSPGTALASATMGNQAGTSTITIIAPPATVDTIVAVPATATPTISISAGAGRNARMKFRVLDANAQPIANQAFQVSSSNTLIATVAPVGPGVTNAQGEGEFVVTLTAAARKNDTADIGVGAGGKSTVWKLTVK